MRTALPVLLAALLALPLRAQVVRVPVEAMPVVPVARGPVVTELDARLAPLAAAPSAAAMATVFQAAIAPAPAAPEAFAARAALTQALAAPEAGIPALAASLRAAGGKKARRAARALETVGRTLAASPAAERASLSASAAALAARFDGAAAAPGEAVDLASLPTDEGRPAEKKAARRLKAEISRTAALQEVLAAAKTQAVLVVVQGMDAAGKDGVIKHALSGLNPAWTKVSAFKKPTPEEAAEHFLARIRREVPEPGIVGVFNRSHYEDVLVPTVFKTFPEAEVESRYAQIVRFEAELAARGVRVVKIFLHESKKTQRARLQARLDRPEKRWKFSRADLDSRARWDDFQAAYASVLARTSTVFAPWRVIPADSKPRRDLSFAKLLRKTLARMGLAYPAEEPGLDAVRIPK
jgi:PPK2 family polyphosphate:nucleotide phosphotransferase